MTKYLTMLLLSFQTFAFAVSAKWVYPHASGRHYISAYKTLKDGRSVFYHTGDESSNRESAVTFLDATGNVLSRTPVPSDPNSTRSFQLGPNEDIWVAAIKKNFSPRTLVVYRFSNAGNLLWQKEIPFNTGYPFHIEIGVDREGYSTFGFGNTDSNRLRFVQISPEGELVLTKDLEAPDEVLSVEGIHSLTTASHTYVRTISSISNPPSVQHTVWKLGHGTIEWMKAFERRPCASECRFTPPSFMDPSGDFIWYEQRSRKLAFPEGKATWALRMDPDGKILNYFPIPQTINTYMYIDMWRASNVFDKNGTPYFLYFQTLLSTDICGVGKIDWKSSTTLVVGNPFSYPTGDGTCNILQVDPEGNPYFDYYPIFGKQAVYEIYGIENQKPVLKASLTDQEFEYTNLTGNEPIAFFNLVPGTQNIRGIFTGITYDVGTKLNQRDLYFFDVPESSAILHSGR